MPRHDDSFKIATRTLRTLDREHYFATLVLPRRARNYVQALYAYGAELAAVCGRVSEPGPGEIRLKWWADAFDGTEHGDVRANPIADALFDAIETFGLKGGPFERIAAARRFDLYDDPMPNLTQLEGYAGETTSILYQTAAIIVNGGKDPGTADAAGHLGVAEVLTRHLMTMPQDFTRGRIRVPLSVFVAAGTSEAELLASKQTPGLLAATAQLREVARSHLAKARVALAHVPKRVRPVFAPIALVELNLDRLDRGGTTPLEPVHPAGEWRKLAALVGFALMV